MDQKESTKSQIHSVPTNASDTPSSSDTPSTHIHAEPEPHPCIENQPPTKMLFLLTLLTCFSGFMFGYDTGYVSGALVVIGDALGKILEPRDKELITAATSLGALIFACLGGALADTFGRKYVIIFSNTMFILGSALQTGANTLWTMIAGRFVMGFGVGLASLMAPLYLSEMANSRFRGRLVVLNVLAITLGQLVAYAIGAGLTNVKNGWRILVGLSLVPAVLQMSLFFFMPETPRYLVLRGKVDRAAKVIRIIYKDASNAQVQEKIADLVSSMPVPVANLEEMGTTKRVRARLALASIRRNFRELFAVGSNRRGLAIVVGLQLLQQFSGWNALMYYSATIFQNVGFAKPTSVSIIIAGTNFAFTVFAFFVIDKIGRRRLLVSTLWGLSVALVICAVAFHYLPFDDSGEITTQNSLSDKWGKVVVVFMFVYAACYATGIGNVPWQQGEVLNTQVRGVGTSLATAANWTGSLIVSATFLTMMRNITPSGTFAFYAGICALGEVLVYLFYPETAGLDLEDIHQLLNGGFHVKQSINLSSRARA